jgi:hypothetical protein
MFRKHIIFALSFFVLVQDPLYANQDAMISNVSNNYADVIELTLKMTESDLDKNFLGEFKKLYKAQMSKGLKEQFSSNEIEEINRMIEITPNKSFAKVLEVLSKSLQEIMNTKNNLKDFQLDISPTYDAAIENNIRTENIVEKIKSYYIKDHAGTTSGDVGTEADAYAKIAVKHLKKLISDYFPEDVYVAYYGFQESPLGKKTDLLLERTMESVVNSLTPDNKV